jgi:hypothetical protein
MQEHERLDCIGLGRPLFGYPIFEYLFFYLIIIMHMQAGLEDNCSTKY